MYGSEETEANVFAELPNFKLIGWEGLVGDNKKSWAKITKMETNGLQRKATGLEKMIDGRSPSWSPSRPANRKRDKLNNDVKDMVDKVQQVDSRLTQMEHDKNWKTMFDI